MATKRKSDALDDAGLSDLSSSGKENDASFVPVDPAAKKARVADASEGAATTSKAKAKGKGKKGEPAAPRTWQEVVLEGEDDVSPSITHIRVTRMPICFWMRRILLPFSKTHC
jgi:hypothetical protein